MKSIKLNAVITSIRSKVDRSLGLTIGTPELSVLEKVAFMELQGENIILLISPMDEAPDEIKVDKDLNPKSFGKEMRDYCYVYCKESNLEFEQSWEAYKEKQRTNWRKKLDEMEGYG